MQVFLAAATMVLVVNMLVSLLRVVRGPAPQDRVAGVALVSTTGVGVLLVLAELTGESSLRVTGLILVALATTVVVVLVALREQAR